MGRQGDFDFLYLRLFPIVLKELGLSLNEFFPIYFQLMFFLALFIAGPTIYAPFTAFLTLAFYGIIFGSLSASYDFKTAVISLFFTALCGYVLTVYATFVTLTSMKIFTDVKKPEGNVLEGILFRANKFKGIFNFRYIGSYLLFFLFFTAFASAVLMFKNYLLSLL